MKKTFLLFLSLLTSYLLSAQTPLMNNQINQSFSPKKLNVSTMQLRNMIKERTGNKTRDLQSYWLNYGLSIDSLNGHIAQTWSDYLFPDSTIWVSYGGTDYSRNDVFNIGNIMNPLSLIFQIIDGVTLTATDPYTLDSLGIYYNYIRNTSDTIVDTLLVTVYQDKVRGASLPLFYYTGESGSYGVDTIYVPFQKYDYKNNKAVGGFSQLIKVPLTAADATTADGLALKIFGVTKLLNVPAGHDVACGITFKPGYNYLPPLDTIEKTGNVFSFASNEENGAGNYQTYFPGDYNVSAIVTQNVRYNMDQNGYNGYYIPSYAFISGDYPFEDHLILYHIYSGVVGIPNISVDKNSLAVYPNPASDIAVIKYNLNNQSDVKINIADVTGKVMRSFFNSEQGAGLHTQLINVRDLPSGIYLVSIVAGNEKPVVAKLTVTR